MSDDDEAPRTTRRGKAKAAGRAKLDKAGQLAGRLGDAAREKAHAGVLKALDEFEGARPHLEAAGYRVVDVVVTVSIPPRFGAILEPQARGAERLDAVLAGEGLTKPQRALLLTLREAALLDGMVQDRGYRSRLIRLDLGVPPKVRAHLAYDDPG